MHRRGDPVEPDTLIDLEPITEDFEPIAEDTIDDYRFLYTRTVDAIRGNGSRHRIGGTTYPAILPPAQELPRHVGPLPGTQYAIPYARFKSRRYLLPIPLLLIVGGSVWLHHDKITSGVLNQPWLLAMWIVALGFVLVQLVLAWCQKAFTVNETQAAVLDQMKVTVVVPCYNEAPELLDRTIFSLFSQSRLPDHVIVTDDGSKIDYTEVRQRWESLSGHGIKFTWIRQDNQGKKHAQATAIRADFGADIYVTIDSDSALEHRALEEGLKPFADERVTSVAGLESAFNFSRNTLTRSMAARVLIFQLYAMSAQSVARGQVLINPGAFSLYRGWLIRKVLDSYVNELWFGMPVRLGDDTMLTFYSLMYGRAVHQPSAFAFNVYPETLSQHLRQWTRWMRGSTIRTLWRIKYLPKRSYGWIFSVWQQWAFYTSVAITIAIPLAWPATERLLYAGAIALVLWPTTIGIRWATVWRSDVTLRTKLWSFILLPFAALWYMLVLRQIRFYGMATCHKQGWVTRVRGAEVEIGRNEVYATIGS
jgi:hyaluronan synthase